MDENEENVFPSQEPLCVFDFTYTFDLVPHDQYPDITFECQSELNNDKVISTKKRKRKIRSRTAKVIRRRTDSWKHGKAPTIRSIVEYLTERYLSQSNGRIPLLPEVVDTVQNVWSLEDETAPFSDGSRCVSVNDNDKSSQKSSDDIMPQKRYDKNLNGLPYPGLLRRRLSAPEIIMRKHSLSKENSFESESTQNSTPTTFNLYPRSFWGNRASSTGSDSNLSYNRKTPHIRTSQADSIRRTTLLRCMRTRSRETELSSSTGHIDGSRKTTRAEEYFVDIEVQKSCENLNVPSSSSDSKNNNLVISSSSAGMKKDNQDNSQNLRVNQDSTYSSKTSRGSTSDSVNSTFYSSSSSDIHSLQTTSNETDNNLINDGKDPAADSAYINSVTNSSESKSVKIISDSEQNNHSDVTIDVEVNGEDTEKRINIVSNLNVNATTVNLIMHSDKNNEIVTSLPEKNMASESTNLTSFYLKSKDDVQITPGHCRLIKYMISNIRAGSIYTKPYGETPVVVPRYSAMPRTTSMEVNPSSPDSTDKESDCASLVDSLDDPQSPRQSAVVSNKHRLDDKPVRGDLSILIPDNSRIETPKRKVPKPAAFFIPMLSQDSIDKDKPVSERMPENIRDRLEKRKQLIDSKKVPTIKPFDLTYNDLTRDDNGNRIQNPQYKFKNEINPATYRRKPKVNSTSKRTTNNKVPDINSNTFPLRRPKRLTKTTRRKFQDENEDTSTNSSSSYFRQSSSLASTPLKNHEPFIEIKENTNRHRREPISKKIEILQVTEETSNGHIYHHNVSKSKIPIPVYHKQNSEYDRFLMNRAQYCPYSLLHSPDDDPKVDQLIANLLMDTLNTASEEIQVEISSPAKEEIRPTYIISTKQNQSNWYKQKFAMIPEERTLSSSNENVSQNVSLSKSESDIVKSVEVETQVEDKELSNNNSEEKEKNKNERVLIDASSQTDVDDSTNDNLTNNNLNDVDKVDNDKSVNVLHKGKAALGKNEDATIPQGWITFYMLRNNPGSSSSTDDGVVKFTKSPKKTAEVVESVNTEIKPVLAKRKLGFQNNAVIINEESQTALVKREPNMDENSDDFNKLKKDQITSSSDCKSHFLTSDHDSEKQSLCPSLPLSSYLPLRKNRRLNQRRNRLKISQNPWKNMSDAPGEWSVTVSGVNSCGQPVPDVEMRLKFPNSQVASQSDSGFGEENPGKSRGQPDRNENTSCLPPAPPARRKYTVITKKDDFLDKDLLNNKSFHYLPDLIKNKNQRILSKGCGTSVTVRSTQAKQVQSATVRMPPLPPRAAPSANATSRPRQTLTSYRRFSLRHSTHLPPQLRVLHSIGNLQPRDIVELPECFTNHLSVMGSAIPQEMKSRVPSLPKQDVNKNYTFQQYQI